MAGLWSFLTSVPLLMVLLWLGLAAFSVTLVILIWTRWGQYRPLRKCFLLSLLAHLLLAGYATTVQLVAWAPTIPAPAMHVVLLDWPVGPGSGPNTPAGDRPSAPQPEDTREGAAPAVAPASSSPPHQDIPAKVVPPAAAAPPGASLPPMPEPDSLALTEVASPDPAPAQALLAERNPLVVTDPNPPAAVQQGPADSEGPGRVVPEIYRLRMSGDHLQAAVGGGGSPETEAAVQAALRWLSSNQEPDGRWQAKRHEAGRDTMTDGRSRPNAGLEADAGMTGLALLSLLGAGHTHHRGSYQENVRRALEFLLAIQAPSGSLAGGADNYAAMYCHGMATFALGEAFGVTGDPRLEQPLRRAIGYTVAAQDPLGGGWRYRPRDPGDTSQLGWQLMALRSAELAGIPIPEPTRANTIRYLQSVAAGQHGGLASYRPRERVTRTMTAEGLFCWQLLGMTRQHPAGNEAGDFLLGDLPGQGPPNFYYWYYATLATFRLQGRHWERWNDALRTHLVATQQRTEPLAGSWDPDPVWGGYGGRIYSTSLATLSLEVYYRYLPLCTHGGGE
jgi:hypothetical protein